MTEIILNFPVRNVAGLTCVWIETGNPTQPLVCQWVSRQKSNAAQSPEIAEEPHLCRPCA